MKSRIIVLLNDGPGVICRLKVAAADRFSFSDGWGRPWIDHCQKVLYGIVTEIAESISVTCPPGFCVEIVPPDSLANWERGFLIEGHSADVAVLCGMLGATLDLPCREDVILTGSLLDESGRIGGVDGLRAKAEAFLQDESSRTFLYPADQKDEKVMGPGGLGRVGTSSEERADLRSKKRFEVVRSLEEVFPCLFDDFQVIARSLQAGWFAPRAGATWFIRNLEERFWCEWRRALEAERYDRGEKLLERRLSFHERRKEYPTGFVGQLRARFAALPYVAQRLAPSQCVVPQGFVPRLEALADPGDREELGRLSENLSLKDANALEENEIARVVGKLVEKASRPVLLRDVYAPIEEAFATFPLSANSVPSAEAFWQLIERFLAHQYRFAHGLNSSGPVPDLAVDASKAVGAIADRFGGLQGLLTEAMRPTRGGLRPIFEALVDHQKSTGKRAHVDYYLTRLIQPFDFTFKVNLARSLMERFKGCFSTDILEEPPEHYANHLEILLSALIDSGENLRTRSATI